jgi:SAM-dependent methyltransferase
MMSGGSPGAWAENTEHEVQFAVRALRLHPGDRVLDLGCGWGRHSLPLAAYGLNVTGLDLSRDLLAVARYNARRHGLAVNWVEANVMNLPLRGSFDAVAQFCGNLLTWFSSREQARQALENVAALVRPGGRVLLGASDWQHELPNRSQQWDEWDGGAAIYRYRFDRRERFYEAQTVVFGPEHRRAEYWRRAWWPSAEDMEDLFDKVGLRVCLRTNGCSQASYDPNLEGLVYVLVRE